MKPVTKWTRYDPQKQEWRFNHIEDGHSNLAHPVPKFPSQSGWVRAQWVKEHAWMTDEKPARLIDGASHHLQQDLQQPATTPATDDSR